MLIYASVCTCLALTLDAPGFIASGLPQPHVRIEVQQFFNDENWPTLMRHFGAAACGLLMFIGLCGLVIARRRGGFAYILRGIIGSLGLLLAMIPLSTLVPNDLWDSAAPLFKTRQIGLGIDDVLRNFHGAPLYLAGAIFLLSTIIAAIPARKKPVVVPVRPTLVTRPTVAAPPPPPPPLTPAPPEKSESSVVVGESKGA